ncbi:hypothetical protein VD0002_g6188 [Verticillium dahliae]|uniref:Uncharacterized protein n=1 Tax=Verticillium dahliae TaxID=27337 RepID=A0AA44WGW7_VERDA|nr:hypothetical protein BJF96_g7302 [Verticillium dahliae]PNH54528.1 hypothetical protein VD0003_g3004 [Verticillium dahliae]PNH61671.1 hypothetical protein VD0002_g6188 [Verticillium dahliae]
MFATPATGESRLSFDHSRAHVRDAGHWRIEAQLRPHQHRRVMGRAQHHVF